MEDGTGYKDWKTDQSAMNGPRHDLAVALRAQSRAAVDTYTGLTGDQAMEHPAIVKEVTEAPSLLTRY